MAVNATSDLHRTSPATDAISHATGSCTRFAAISVSGAPTSTTPPLPDLATVLRGRVRAKPRTLASAHAPSALTLCSVILLPRLPNPVSNTAHAHSRRTRLPAGTTVNTMDIDGGAGMGGGLPHTDSLSDLMNSPVHTGVKSSTTTTTTSHVYTSGASPGRQGVPMMRSPGPGGRHLAASPINAGGRLSARVGYGSPRSFYTRTTPRNQDPDAPAKPAYGSFYRGAGDSPGPGSYNTTSYAYNKVRDAVGGGPATQVTWSLTLRVM